jgi:cobalt/nickel transport protein
MKQTAKGWQNWLLVVGVVILSIAPLVLVKDGKFSGADDQAGKAINEFQPDYKPWSQPIFTPASGEIASLLFASQAALGAGIIGYVIGLSKGRSENSRPSAIDTTNFQAKSQIKSPLKSQAEDKS